MRHHFARFSIGCSWILQFSATLILVPPAATQAAQPAELFREIDDAVLGEAAIVNGKQLFVDDLLVAKMDGVRRELHQPAKHKGNPVIVPDQPGEKALNRGSVLYDQENRLFKMWYIVYDDQLKNQLLAYATSEDGISWKKPVVNAQQGNNIIPDFQAANPPCVIKDERDRDPARRYKMLFGEPASNQENAWVTSAAFSSDGLRWKRETENPLIPHSDTLSCPFWDATRNRYIAFVRYGPPNIRIVSRIESEDFIRWSPKVTVLRTSAIDQPFQTQLYGMNAMPYAGVYFGLITAYHGETIQPIPADQLWRDRKNVQLAYSRNGLTWQRIGSEGVIDLNAKRTDDEWHKVAERAEFIPYGAWPNAWDAGVVYPFHAPIVVDDEIFIYYYAHNGRNWWNYHKDRVQHGIGLARLRLDGFVSISAQNEGTLTTKPFVFIGDTLIVNAEATGGSIRIEAFDEQGKVIPGFSKEDSVPIESDATGHIVAWSNQLNCQALQARPITLQFHMLNAKLYSIEPRIRFKHLSPPD